MRDFWLTHGLEKRRREDFVRLAALRDLKAAGKINDLLRWI